DKGANGTNGTNGDKGDKGDKGDAGAAGIQLMTSTNPDTWVDNGRYSSMKLDGAGNPVISDFGAGELRLTHCFDPACLNARSNAVNNVFGQYSSLQLDSSGFPVISYYNAVDQVLELAHCVDANCDAPATVNIVDSSGNVGEYSSLVLDNDIPVISYYDTTAAK